MPTIGQLIDSEPSLGAANDASQGKGFGVGAMLDYEAMAEAEAAQRVRQSTALAVKTAPEQAAKVQQIADATGLPIDVVNRNLDQAQQQQRLREINDAMQVSPVLRRQMMDVRFAQLAQDDAHTLTEAERAVGTMRPVQGPQPGLLSIVSGLSKSFAQGTEAVREGLRMQWADAIGSSEMKADAQRKYAGVQLETALSEPNFESSTARGLYSGGVSTLRAIPGVVASIGTRSPAPVLATMGLQTEADAYGKYSARGATPLEAARGAVAEGAIESATEMLPMAFLVNKFGKTGFKQFMGGFLARELPTEQLATVLQDAVDTAVANPDKTWGQYFAERPDAAYQTFLATAVQSAVFGAGHKVAHHLTGRESAPGDAQANAAALTDLLRVSGGSKLRERSPATFANFVTEAANDGPVDAVYVDAQTFAQSAANAGIDLAKTMPETAAALQDAIDTKSDVRIPIGEFAAAIPGTSLEQSLVPLLRSDPNGPTQKEASDTQWVEDTRQQTEAMLEAHGFSAERKASAANVETELHRQLTEANRFTPDVNKAYAGFMSAFYATQAARLGLTPEQMQAKYPLRILAQSVDTDRALRQGEHNGQTESQAADQLRGAGNTQLSAVGAHAAEAQRVAAKAAGAIGEQKETQVTESSGQHPQPAQEGTRGSITIDGDIKQNTPIITLLPNADLSTFLHESGHFYLEVLADMARQPNAPAPIVDDFGKTVAWFGVTSEQWASMTLDEKRPYHEQFARGFEAYLFEGKAPSTELNALFARFRAWLINVYKQIRALNVELSDEVRGVMDRLLATNEEIIQAEVIRNLRPLFESKPAQMSDAEWAAYLQGDLDAQQEAVGQLQTRSVRDMQYATNARSRALKKLQGEAAAKRAEVRAEVTAEVKAEPVYAAREFLLHGTETAETVTHLLPSTKLNDTALAEMFPESMLARPDLSKLKGMTAADGLLPDDIAEKFHYASGDAMVRDLIDAEPMRDKIEGLTDQRMLERYGDLADPAAIEKAASEAVANDVRLKVLATESSMLTKMVGGRKLLAEAAKDFATKVIARKQVKDIRPRVHEAAAARAARNAEAAFKKGDLQTAAAEKRVQLVNTYAARSAYEALAEVDKMKRFFARVVSGADADVTKTRDVDVVNAARAILAEYGYGAKAKTAAEYLKAVEAHDPGMYDVLRDRVDAAAADAKPFSTLTFEEVTGLHDEIDSLWHLARRSRQMEIDGDLMDREDVQAQLRARLEEIGIPDRVPGEGSAITPAEKRLGLLRTFAAAARRVESWIGVKDAGNARGPFRSFIWNPVREAADAYRLAKAAHIKKFRELLDPIAPTLTRRLVDAPELGYVFGKDEGGVGMSEVLHALAHTGNESNKKKLLLGRHWAVERADGSIDTTRWDAFVNRLIADGTLTKAHFDFVQGVWDLLETLKPMAQKTHRDVFGSYFKEITADSFGTPFGVYKGGYVPAMADSRIVSDAKTRALAEEDNASLSYAFPSTNKGFTKARVEYNRPLLLDLRTLAQHIDKVLLFSHMERPVRDVRRVLTSRQVAYALNRIQPEAFDNILTPWLLRAARQQVETPVAGAQGLMRFFAAARSRAGMAAMFANVSNAVQQFTGISVALLKVRPRYLLGAMADYMKNPRAMARAVAEASPYMATRMDNEVSQMTDAIKQILIDPSTYEKAQAWTQKHSYFLQVAADNVIGPVVWTGAYNEAIEHAPADLQGEDLERHARRIADAAVRETQGSTQPEDVSRIETGNAFVRMFTQFAGYFNTQANLLGTEFVNTSREMGLKKGAGRGLYILAFGFLAPAWVSEIIAQLFRGGPGDDDKDGQYLDDWLAAVFGWGTLRYATAMAPGVGQVINAGVNTLNAKPYDDRISTAPAISMIESAVQAPKSVYKAVVDHGSAQKAVRDVATLLTMLTGLPIAGVARPLGYAAGIANNDIRPTSEADAVRGIVTGAASPQSK